MKGFVVIDDNFKEAFEATLPPGHFCQTIHGIEAHPPNPTFDKEKHCLTKDKVEEALQMILLPYEID